MHWTQLLAFVFAPWLLARSAKKPTHVKATKSRPAPASKKTAKPVVRAKVTPTAVAKPLPASGSPLETRGKVVAPTSIPRPVAPVAGERLLNTSPRFGWVSVASATHYQVMWGTDPSLAKSQSLLVDRTAAELEGENALISGTTYYWRVRAGNEAGWGPWSSIQEFGTSEEPASS